MHGFIVNIKILYSMQYFNSTDNRQRRRDPVQFHRRPHRGGLRREDHQQDHGPPRLPRQYVRVNENLEQMQKSISTGKIIVVFCINDT